MSLRDIDLPQETGPGMVKIAIHTVGVCGSDVHYYTHGKIGPFVVNAPMVLGHEAAGTIVEVGAGVTHLKVGDRVCMEPGIPDPNSKASRWACIMSIRRSRFWATPPVHGVLTAHVVHPANYTFKLPDNVSFAEGAMVEPFAVGMQAAFKAGIKPGDTGVVLGAGPIGVMVAIAALAGGCARVIVADLAQPKLDIAAQYQGVIPVNISKESLAERLERADGRLGRGRGVRMLRLAPRMGDDHGPALPRRDHRGRRPAGQSGAHRRVGGHHQGGAHRNRLPLRPPIRPRHRADGVRQGGSEAADFGDVRVCGLGEGV